jgi:hypothetical protein
VADRVKACWRSGRVKSCGRSRRLGHGADRRAVTTGTGVFGISGAGIAAGGAGDRCRGRWTAALGPNVTLVGACLLPTGLGDTGDTRPAATAAAAGPPAAAPGGLVGWPGRIECRDAFGGGAAS